MDKKEKKRFNVIDIFTRCPICDDEVEPEEETGLGAEDLDVDPVDDISDEDLQAIFGRVLHKIIPFPVPVPTA
jgi:hypothetical protein